MPDDATESGVRDVGRGVRLGTVIDPFGNRLGVIHHPNFDISSTGG